MTMRSAPPGFASTSQTGLVKPLGPHHCASSFGSVQALNTRSRGALKTRVIVISRSAKDFGRAAAMWTPLRLGEGTAAGAAAALPALRSGGLLFADHHPGRAELVGEHAEARGEER